MIAPLAAFAEAVSAAGIPPSKHPCKVSGKIERFIPSGDHQENGWYILVQLNQVVVGCFGCWKRDIKQKFCSAERTSLTADQWREVHQAWKDAEVARIQEEQASYAAVRDKCKALFDSKPNTALITAHEYLKIKGVKPHGRLQISANALTLGWLAMPLCDETGMIHSAQFIAPDGAKRFEYRGRKKGCWFTLADNPEGPIVICEGYATGASIHEATGWSVLCACDCGNLPSVAKAAAKLHPKRPLLIAGDDDQFTAGNPGRSKAQEAAAGAKATAAFPVFADESLEVKPTDFNDLHKLAGLPEVKRQLVEAARMGGNWFLLIEDAADTMTEVLPDPTQIVEGIICDLSKLLIGGSSKTYKTWFLMDLALSISAGKSFLGRVCLKKRVLYVNLELKGSTFKRRLQTIVHAKGIHCDHREFHHLSLRGKMSQLTTEAVVTRLITLAHDYRCEVMCLDPIYKLNTEGGDENAAGEQTVFLNELDRLTTEGRCTLLMNDHFGKGNQAEKDPLDAFRGSSVKGGDIDAAITLRKHKEPGSFSIDIVHRELPPVEPFVITWHYPLFETNNNLDAADMNKPKGGRPKTLDPITILYAFEHTTAQDGLSASNLSRKIGMARQTLQPYLHTLRSKGWITTAGDGRSAFQFITQAGIDRLKSDQNETARD